MESYKHSCPYCGQHIEYTAGYCGKQMACPICGKPVTFPAVPPGGKGPALHIKRPEAARAAKWSFNLNDILASLRQFEHWNVVLLCLVPFIIVAALLVGASVVRKNASNEPAMPVAPPIQVDPNAWQKMTDLARADQLVQEQLGVVARARAAATAAAQIRDARHAYYQGKTLDRVTYDGVMLQLHTDEQAAANAQRALDAARQAFDNAFQNYQRLGGTVDYRRQLPQ
jgi:hypothetical protein